MSVEIIEVKTAKEKKVFIDFEWEINKNTPNWVSPLKMERTKILNIKKNPFFQHSEIQLFLAKKDGKISGRIAAITNENYTKFQKDDAGFWGFFDCIDDQETANALFDAAANWLKNKNRDKMIGPMNPSLNDEAGLLIDGFDTPPYIMMTHNPEYYSKLVDGYGNKKAKDVFALHVTVEDANTHISEKMRRVADKTMKRYKIKLREIDLKNFKKDVNTIMEIYNDAWSDNWGFVPFTDAEIDILAADLKQITDPRMVLFAEISGEPIGFIVTIPNINEVLVNIPNGKLFPSGVFKLLTGIKKIKTLRVIILGIKKGHQRSGLGANLYLKSILLAKELGYEASEMSWILEDNYTMIRPLEDFGAKKYKKYRIYTYPLI
jgi:GNAT superfamily N-acetyltransferase